MEAVNQYGTFLDNHITEKEKCNCYAIDKFFIEVVYDAKHNTIIEVKSFKSGKSLDKYANLKSLKKTNFNLIDLSYHKV